MKNINKYELKDDYAILSIINSKGEKVETKIDKEMVEELKHYSFRVNDNGYIKTKKSLYIHRIIIGDIPKGKEIDHINRDKLDNRKSNLRIVNHKENCNNRLKTEKTGITKLKRLKSKPYQLRINGKHIGYYSTFDEALKIKLTLTT